MPSDHKVSADINISDNTEMRTVFDIICCFEMLVATSLKALCSVNNHTQMNKYIAVSITFSIAAFSGPLQFGAKEDADLDARMPGV